MALRKKAKYIRPYKVSIRTISGVSTANVDWRTITKDGVSGVESQVEASNNYGSTTVDNDTIDKSSGERAVSTDSISSLERINGVVSPSDLVVNVGPLNQKTIIELVYPVKDSDKEGDF